MRVTEERMSATVGIDRLAPSAVVESLFAAHADVPEVLASAEAATTEAVELTAGRLERGGRLVYVASGTPGWLVGADAAELPPTFGLPPERLLVVRARSARAAPGNPDEDAPGRGAQMLSDVGVAGEDVVVAVAASGSTPFTLGAMQAAAAAGAATIAVTVVAGSPMAIACDVAVVLATGAEPIMGSTRMRAGLAQRLWLTVFSTAVMVRLGRTHDNLMINVQPVLAKLRERRVAIAAEATGLPGDAAAELLDRAGDDLGVAIVMHLAAVDSDAATAALARASGRTRIAIADLCGGDGADHR